MRFSLHHGGQKGCLGRGGCCTEPAMLLKACTPGFNQCCELAPQELGPDTCVSAHEGARPLCHKDHTSPFAKLRGYEPTCLRHCKHRVLSASATSGWRAGDGSRVFRSRHGYPMCLLSCSGHLCSFAWGRGRLQHETCCAHSSTQSLAGPVFFQLQETVPGRASLNESLTFYNPLERKE